MSPDDSRYILVQKLNFHIEKYTAKKVNNNSLTVYMYKLLFGSPT